VEDEVQHLRRSLRDIVAFTMLPSVWTGSTTAQICADVIEVVSRAVDCDAVHLSLQSSVSADLLRLRNEDDAETRRAIGELAGQPPRHDVQAVPASGRPDLRVVGYPLSADPSDRLIVASFRADFPNEIERLMLRVAANQASLWIERRKVEIALASESEFRKNAEEAASFIARASEILSRSLDYEETLQSITAIVVPQLADWCFVDLVDADGSFQRIAVAHARPEDLPLATRLRRSYAPKSAAHGVSRTFARGQTTLMNEVSPEVLMNVARDDDHREVLLALGIRCFVSVPMTSRGTTFGVLTFLGTHQRLCFEPSDVALAEELARRAALAFDNASLYRKAQEANRAKDEFLANLSHELRTPMTAILGWAHLLEMGDLEEPQARLGIATIKQSAQAQAKLIDDLLDVSRIITGKLYLNSAEADLAEIVRNATAAIRPAVHAKRQQLDLDVGVEHVTVWADASRLQQVFWNLFANAVKFTPAGGSIRVQLAADFAGHVSVSIRDTGEGIAAEFLPLVFDRFRQAATIHRGRTGLGLGLAITKELVEMHGGSISAASDGEGHGSTFTVVLPRYTDHQPPAAPAPVQSRSRLQSLRILLVEDDEGTRMLLETLLNAFGAEVTAASCATDAEALFVDCRPQVLITDIGMPGDDGLMLLQRLRSSEPSLPAIAVSGYAETATRDRVLSVGFNGFITKPVDPMALIEAIDRAVEG
jgi:signal transduction histidine kinase/CheY-like chemotaxis protein